jgi:hypothetical protein
VTNEYEGEDVRNAAAAINRYLEALQVSRTPGRRRTAEQIEARLQEIERQLEIATTGIQRLHLVQEQSDLLNELDRSVEKHEREFIRVVLPWARHHGIEYSTFRKIGVPAPVLREAGFRR